MEQNSNNGTGPSDDMEFFVGEYSCTLDDNKRLIVPSKFRKTLAGMGKNVSVMIYSKDFLTLYPYSTWKQQIADKMSTLSHEDADALAKRRELGRKTAHIQIDKQGRISIPLTFYQAVGIDKNVVLVGAIDMIQIGSPAVLGNEVPAL